MGGMVTQRGLEAESTETKALYSRQTSPGGLQKKRTR